MATGQGLAALRAHLAKEAACKEMLSTLDDVEALLRNCYPSLDMEINASSIQMTGGRSSEVIVCTPRYVELGDSGPIKPARMVFSDGGSYVFQVYNFF